jgi:predicted ATPase
LLEALAARGYRVVEEPGRRIVRDELKTGGSALPWLDPVAFARRAIATSLQDRAAIPADARWTFLDRSLIDAAAFLEHVTGESILATLGRLHRYHQRVYFTPPWPELYDQDEERRHGFEEAVTEYDRLLDAYTRLNYRIVFLPKAPVAERVALIEDDLARE